MKRTITSEILVEISRLFDLSSRSDQQHVTILKEYGKKFCFGFLDVSWVMLGLLVQPPWDEIPLKEYGKKIQDAFSKGIKKLASMKITSVQPIEFGFGTPGLYGPDTQMHAFCHHDYQKGFRLQEPQLTGAMKYLLSPSTAGREVGVMRCRAFVKSLFRASGLADEMEAFDLPSMDGTLKVTAEENRIDLLFQWSTADKSLRLVAVEVKLGHTVTSGQLPRYKGIVEKKGRSEGSCSKLFVLARHFDGINAKKLKLNKKWAPVTWWGLLRHWELELKLALANSDMKDENKDFPCLRRAMWTLGVGIN